MNVNVSVIVFAAVLVVMSAAQTISQFQCFKCTGATDFCQQQHAYEYCPPSDAPSDLTGYYRCMLTINEIDNSTFQGCVSACKADSNQFYRRTCSTSNRGNCIPGLQCTQYGPDVIGHGSKIASSFAIVSLISGLSFVAAILRQ